MNIQSDNQSPYINYLNLTLRPDIHNNYAVTVFKTNQEITVELINNQAKVSNNTVTEYWNMQTMHTVNDQITDAVTVTKTTGNQIDTFNDTVDSINTVVVDEPVENNTDSVTTENKTVNISNLSMNDVSDETLNVAVNLNDSAKTAKVLEN